MKRRALLAAAPALLALLALPGQAADDARRSGFDDLSPALQAMQRDETQNPAMLGVRDGEALWNRSAPTGKACAECHADGLAGIAARYPRFDTRMQRPLTLAASIDRCRVQRQGAAAQPPDGDEVLPLTAWLHWQSRGRPIVPDADPGLAAWRARGQALWRLRLGQLNLACTHCHDQRAGQRLGGALIPQAHPTGVPTYRLEWQGLGSLQRRLRSCLVGVRAEPFAPASDEALALETYLVQRAAGMALEGAAIRP
ncbi:sulfur oxidation c-type cytochrome SoxA [Aquabacterium sp.]|uniref:sulfur oxidation c-type cytochrome SoxA n=1 Tax=Aquabacterium sp. TaxID=1872578 RepID=UPI003784ED40